MTIKEAVVNNKVGLHARPATFFIQKSNDFKGDIWIEKGDRRANAKSLLGVLSLGVLNGETVRISADGVDEKLAVDTLIGLLTNGLRDCQ